MIKEKLLIYGIFILFIFSLCAYKVSARVESICMGNCSTGFTGSLSNQELLSLNVGSIGNNGEEGTFLFSFYYHSSNYQTTLPVIRGVRLLTSDGLDAFACDIGSMSAVKNSNSNDVVAYIVTPVCKINGGQYADRIDIQFGSGVYGDYKTSLSGTFYSSDTLDTSSIVNAIQNSTIGITSSVINSNNNLSTDLQSKMDNQTNNIVSAINGLINSNQSVINNQNQNTQDIINNQNQNSDKIKEELTTCQDFNFVYKSNGTNGNFNDSSIPSCTNSSNYQTCYVPKYYLTAGGSGRGAALWNYIDYYPISDFQNKSITINFDFYNGTTSSIPIKPTIMFRDENYQWIQMSTADQWNQFRYPNSCTNTGSGSNTTCKSSMTFTVPGNAYYMAFNVFGSGITISNNDGTYYKPTSDLSFNLGQVCSNKLDGMTDSINNNTNAINGLNDSITSTDSPSNSDINGFLDDIDTSSDTPISDLVLMPITLLNAFNNGMNGTCTPYNLGTLYGTPLILPCIDLESYLGSNLWQVIDGLFSLFMIYEIAMMIISIFESITSLEDLSQQLYSPRHGVGGRVERGELRGDY